MQNILVDNAKITAQGQITLPEEIRKALGVQIGDRITFISQGNQVVMMNAAVYAMKMLQESMQGEAEKADITSAEDVINLVHEIRSGKKPDELAD